MRWALTQTLRHDRKCRVEAARQVLKGDECRELDNPVVSPATP